MINKDILCYQIKNFICVENTIKKRRNYKTINKFIFDYF